MAKHDNQAAQNAPQVPPAYTLEELLSSSAAFQCKPEVIVGALNYKYGSKKDRFTKAEVRSAIEEFKKKEVK